MLTDLYQNPLFDEAPLRIGKFYIYIPDFKSEKVCIEREDGEGMKTSVEKFEQCIQEFWNKEFQK